MVVSCFCSYNPCPEDITLCSFTPEVSLLSFYNYGFMTKTSEGLYKTLVLEFLVLLQGNALPSPHNYDSKSRLTRLPTLPSVLTERALPRHYRGEPVGASGAADEPLFQNEVVAVRDLREGC